MATSSLKQGQTTWKEQGKEGSNCDLKNRSKILLFDRKEREC